MAADGLDATNPVDVMTWIDNNFHQPCDLGRAGLPEEIASITTYLVSRRNGYVTGATVNVDGGLGAAVDVDRLAGDVAGHL